MFHMAKFSFSRVFCGFFSFFRIFFRGLFEGSSLLILYII
jgi:hypothetical protein